MGLFDWLYGPRYKTAPSPVPEAERPEVYRHMELDEYNYTVQSERESAQDLIDSFLPFIQVQENSKTFNDRRRARKELTHGSTKRTAPA